MLNSAYLMIPVAKSIHSLNRQLSFICFILHYCHELLSNSYDRYWNHLVINYWNHLVMDYWNRVVKILRGF